MITEVGNCVRPIHAPGWSGLQCDHTLEEHNPITGKCSGHLEFGWGDYPCECEHFMEVEVK